MGLYLAFSLLLLILNGRTVTGQVDLTLEPNATSCEVAKAAIDKINLLTGFNKQHKFLLNRIAYMYGFGEDDLPPNGIGMWGITMENFNYVRGNGWRVNWRRFLNNLDFSALQDEDVFKPYYNALTAFLLIQGQDLNVPARSELKLQYEFWVNVTGVDLSSGKYTETYFMEKSQLLNDEVCMECKQPPSDVVFVFDDSGSIGYDGFDQQKGFIKTVVSHLSDTLATDETQLALVVFADVVKFYKSYTASEEEFNTTLDSFNHTKGYTNLAQALFTAADIVENDTNTRKDDKLVRKIVFFLTDGEGNRDTDLFDNATERLKSIKDIVVFSIGMTDKAKPDELLKAATSKDYVLQYETFEEFVSEVDDILYQTCQITPTPLDIFGLPGFSLNISGILMGAQRVVQFVFPDDQVLLVEISTSANNGSVVEVVYKCDGSTPNKVNYDGNFNLTITKDQSSIEFPLDCGTREKNIQRRSADGNVTLDNSTLTNGTIDNTNATDAPGNTTVSVAFIFVAISDNCQLCSIDLFLNITAVDRARPLLPSFDEFIPEDEGDWLLLVLLVLLSIGLFVGFIVGLCCMVKVCVDIKSNQTVGVYNEPRDAYKTHEKSTTLSNAQLPQKPMSSNNDTEQMFFPVFSISGGKTRDW